MSQHVPFHEKSLPHLFTFEGLSTDVAKEKHTFLYNAFQGCV